MPHGPKPRHVKPWGFNMTDRKLTDAERAAIAARYGATCDVQAVTVCPPCQFTPLEQVQDRWTRKAKRGRDNANAKKGKRDE